LGFGKGEHRLKISGVELGVIPFHAVYHNIFDVVFVLGFCKFENVHNFCGSIVTLTYENVVYLNPNSNFEHSSNPNLQLKICG